MRDFIFNFKSNSYKKGFTIIEVLIAITVIVIISGATAVLLAQSVQAENENLASTEVTLVAQSVVDCFEQASNKDEFVTLISKIDSFTMTENEENFIFKLKTKRYSIEIFCKKDYNSFSFLARSKENKLILNFTYPSA